MRQLLVAIFVFMLVSSPFMAHHAVGEVVHEHGNISSQADHANSNQCEIDCDTNLKTMCCSQAITHCSTTSNYNEVWTALSPTLTSNAHFSNYQDLLLRLIFEAETPPPRV
jgi:hypothetical protein